MIMIVAGIYIFLSYVIFDQQLKITFRKSSGPPEKIHSPLKIQIVQVLPLFANIENFSGPPAERGGGTLEHYGNFHTYQLNYLCLKKSCFQDCWKKCVPVFKNVGEKSAPKNYCPLSLLFVFSNILEKVVNNRLADVHLEKCDLFSDSHYNSASSLLYPLQIF